jgi:hypothetical protein
VTLDLHLLTLPCTIERRSDGAPDDYGTPVPVYTPEDALCEFQQRSRNESEGMAEVGTEQWLLVLAAGTQLTTFDRVVVNGESFELDGPPWPVRHPITGAASHVECTVKRSE